MAATFSTLPEMLRHVRVSFRNPAALAHKQDGAWVRISTATMADTVEKLGEGLIDLGLRPGDRLGIVADPSPFWMLLDLAAVGAGAITVPMFANIAPDNLEFEIRDSGMRFLFVGSASQYQAMQPYFGSLEKIIALPKELASPACASWEQVLAAGARRLAGGSSAWTRRSQAVKPQDSATVIYTSGSTGTPKGVELSHQNLISQVHSAAIRFPLDPAVDSALSCLPLAHVFERMVAYFYLSTGISVYFAEEIKKVGENLREVHPTIITLVPRLLEKMYARMQANVESATGFKQALGRAAWQRAREKPHADPPKLKDKLYDVLVYHKMREALGGKLRLVISGSAPLEPELYTFFLNIGLPVFEGYGLTETSPVIAVNYPGHRKVGAVGPLFPGVEVRIGDDGEILAHGPGVMKGYYGKPEETGQAVAGPDRWMHTGDLGHLDNEGYLKITGRKKELFKTANGKYVAPVPIEKALMGNKLVDMAMVVAEGRPFTSALLFPDLENLQPIKQECGCASMQDADFLRSEPARNFIQQTLDALNAKLNHWEQVQKFYLATRALSVADGELTPTLKIRRHVVQERFRKEIDSMYAPRVQ